MMDVHEMSLAIADLQKRVEALELESTKRGSFFGKMTWRVATPEERALPHIELTFPPIDTTAIPEKPSVIAANRLGLEPFEWAERS